MSNVTVKLTEASNAQLRYFAQVVKGIDLPRIANNAAIIAKLQAVHEGDSITVPASIGGAAPAKGSVPKAGNAAARPAAAAAPAEKAPEDMSQAERKAYDERQQAIRDAEWIEIEIHRHEGAGGAQPVQLQVNGALQHIPRGVHVAIRWPYLHDLQNAVKLEYEMEEDGRSLKPHPREVPAYAYSVFRRGLTAAEAKVINDAATGKRAA